MENMESIEKNLSILDYFAMRIYSLESELSNEFAWCWLALNDNVRNDYKQKAKVYFKKYEESGDEDFANRIRVYHHIFKKNEISKQKERVRETIPVSRN